jgi:hypothetical protein
MRALTPAAVEILSFEVLGAAPSSESAAAATERGTGAGVMASFSTAATPPRSRTSTPVSAKPALFLQR